MTATVPTTRPKLPDFEGREVSRASVKFSGVGTGLSDGLSVAPMALDPGEETYFVIRVRCSGVSHDEDKHELLVRNHKLNTVDMAPIDEAAARNALTQYADSVQQKKAAIEGQLSLDAEQAAIDAEEHDGDGTPPAEVAAAAKERATRQPGKNSE